MYEIFGNLDSADEINEVALALREEGDLENVSKLLEENGLEDWLLEDFKKKEIDYVCDIESAAIGKLQVEAKELKKDKYIDIIKDRTLEYLMNSCDNPPFAVAVRKKDKSLEACMKACVDAIKKEIGVGSGGVADHVVFLAAKNYYKAK